MFIGTCGDPLNICKLRQNNKNVSFENIFPLFIQYNYNALITADITAEKERTGNVQ